MRGTKQMPRIFLVNSLKTCYTVIMIDVNTGEEVETLYKMVQIKGGKRIDKFRTTDIKRALRFHKWYIARYHEGLLMEILPQKKVYDWREKTVKYSFE